MDEINMEKKTPKVDWLLKRIVSGETLAFGSEDHEFWKTHPLGIKLLDDPDYSFTMKHGENDEHYSVVMLGEILQRVTDPQQTLKRVTELGDRVVLVVPNEHGWEPQFQPLQNKKHLRFYDCESLCQELEKAGMKYVIELIDFGGWSFLVADAQKVMN